MEFKRRAWGWYLTLIDARHFKVKILRFKAGGKISLQRHAKRSELWCFLSGLGVMKYGDFSNDLFSTMKKPGDFFEVDVHEWHEYLAVKRTTVLEIQFGYRCAESDIERANV